MRGQPSSPIERLTRGALDGQQTRGPQQRALGRSVRRPIWPVLLISTALLLLAVLGVAVGHFYWTSLRGGVQQMQASMDEASRRQLLLTQQVRDAQAALQARQAELDRLQAELGERGTAPAATERGVAADPVVPPPLGFGSPQLPLSMAQQARLRVRLDAIGRAAARLPPPRPARAPPVPMQPGADPLLHGSRALRAQLEVAESALALADAVLLDTAASAAQRLLLDLYGNGANARAIALHRQLGALRAELAAAAARPR